MYVLILTMIISGNVNESRLKVYDRFEECWEAATILVHNRTDMTARCVLVEYDTEIY